MSDARGAASWDAERALTCTCTEDESSDGSATYEDDPHCPIHGWCPWRAEVERLREQLDAARRDLRRATYLAEHLWQMIHPETWRDTGGTDGQGHYEGDYRAEQTRVEIQELSARAALGVEGEQEPGSP